jgi:tripartite-type tricarboxylate transporter receptor subunit TctC
MKMTRWFTGAIAVAALATSAESAQDYPTRPVRLVTSGIGGGADTVARLFTPGLSDALGQRLVIDNRASGTIPGEIAARANPDGYTLLLYNATLWVEPLLQKTPYDVIRDFAPVSLISQSPNILVVTPSLPVQSVQDLVTLARTKPGALNYASGSTGSSNHVAAELFKAMAGVDIVRIAYKSGALQSADLIGGRVELMFASISMVPHIKAGRLRAIAVTSAKPSTLFPGLPTVAAAGLPGYESGSNFALFAPAKTQPAIIRQLTEESAKVLRSDDYKKRFLEAGMEAVGGSPADLAATIKSDVARMGKILKALKD